MSRPTPDDEFKKTLAEQLSGLLIAAHLYGSTEGKARYQDAREQWLRSMQEHAVKYAELIDEALRSNWMPALPLYQSRTELMVDIGDVALDAQARIGWMCEWKERELSAERLPS